MNKEINTSWLNEYFSNYELLFSEDVSKKLLEAYDILLEIKMTKNKLIFAGNGASASNASHASVDFTKQAGIQSINFNEVNLITAFSNDYGYENYIAKALEFYGDQGDIFVPISVSGESKNLINGVIEAKKKKIKVITFTGKSSQNSLKTLGNFNFHYPSNSYNIVENAHIIWLTCLVDMMIGKSEYLVS